MRFYTSALLITLAATTSLPLRLLSGQIITNLNIQEQQVVSIHDVCIQSQKQLNIPIVTFPDPPGSEKIIENQELSLTRRNDIFIIFATKNNLGLKFLRIASSGDAEELHERQFGSRLQLEICGDLSKIFAFVHLEKKCYIYTPSGAYLQDFEVDCKKLPQARAISYDGSLFAMIHQKNIVIQDTQTSTNICSIPIHEHPDMPHFNSIQICSDKVAVKKSGSKPSVLIYDFRGKILHLIKGDARLSPDFRMSAILENGRIRIMEVYSKEILYQFEDHVQVIHYNAIKNKFSSEGQCVFFCDKYINGFWYLQSDINSRTTMVNASGKSIDAHLSEDGKFIVSRNGEGKYSVSRAPDFEDTIVRFEGTNHILNTLVFELESAVLHCIPRNGRSET